MISKLRSKLYTADLESGLHYLLRVELAAHRTLAGAELKTLKDFVTIVAKVCGVCSGLGARSMTLRNEADLSWMCGLLTSGAQPAFGTRPEGALSRGSGGGGAWAGGQSPGALIQVGGEYGGNCGTDSVRGWASSPMTWGMGTTGAGRQHLREGTAWPLSSSSGVCWGGRDQCCGRHPPPLVGGGAVIMEV